MTTTCVCFIGMVFVQDRNNPYEITLESRQATTVMLYSDAVTVKETRIQKAVHGRRIVKSHMKCSKHTVTFPHPNTANIRDTLTNLQPRTPTVTELTLL